MFSCCSCRSCGRVFVSSRLVFFVSSMCVDFSLMVCKRVGLALPSISVLRGRTFSRMFSGVIRRSAGVSFAKWRARGTDGAHINIVGLVSSGSFPPGANGRVKTSHGRFNASVLACASRTDLVVRIFEG